MTDLLLQKFTQKNCKDSVPNLKIGYQVKVHQKIKEGNKERIQIFEGIIIQKGSGHGINETFTVRKISQGIGVEKVFPIHSPNIVKIEVVRAHKVRRSKLNFLRSLSGKALRLKEIPLKLEEKKFEKVSPIKKEEEQKNDEKTEEVVTKEPAEKK